MLLNHWYYNNVSEAEHYDKNGYGIEYRKKFTWWHNGNHGDNLEQEVKGEMYRPGYLKELSEDDEAYVNNYLQSYYQLTKVIHPKYVMGSRERQNP